MIKIHYASIPHEYYDFIDKFKKKIEKWLRNGYIGNVGTVVPLCRECRTVFRYLKQKDNLKRFLLTNAEDIPGIIRYIESKYPQLTKDRKLDPNDKKTPRSDLYKCLYKAFVKLGYNDSDFPNYQITEQLGLHTCPYCNAEEIIYQTIIDENGNSHQMMDSELDHFYPKSRIPYLATNIYNLVPSATLCNGANGKHDKDTYELNLVNPFALQDSKGISFEIDCFYPGVLDYRTFVPNCRIRTLTLDTNLVPNRKTFNLKGRYEHEIEKAKKVWMLNRKVMSVGYAKIIEEKKKEVGVELSFEEWINDALDIDCIEYKKKLSKFCVDIWRQLQRTRI